MCVCVCVYLTEAVLHVLCLHPSLSVWKHLSICIHVSVCMCFVAGVCILACLHIWQYLHLHFLICLCFSKSLPSCVACSFVFCAYIYLFYSSLCVCVHIWVGLGTFLTELDGLHRLRASWDPLQLPLPTLIPCFVVLHHLPFAHPSPPSISLSNSQPLIICKGLSAACSLCSGEKQLHRNTPLPLEPSRIFSGLQEYVVFHHSIFGELREGLSLVLKKLLVWAQACVARTYTQRHTHNWENEREKNIKVPSLLSRARICCHGNPPTPSPKNHQEEVMATRRDWLIPFSIFSEKGLFIARTGHEIPCPCLAQLHWDPRGTSPLNSY